MGKRAAQKLDRCVPVEGAVTVRALVLVGGLLSAFAAPVSAQQAACKVLCEPTLLVEPTITW